MSYLLDTNILAEIIRPKPHEELLSWITSIPNENLHISVLTLGEIRKGIQKLPHNHKREKLRIWLEHELPTWFEERILPIDPFIADRWGRLQAEAGKTLPVIDALIAATALHYDFAIVTRNSKDFNFPTLNVINPWLLK
jgi:predicted nucleic acid-binding protein